MTQAVVFPGQGAQSVGMLAELNESYPSIQQRFAEASDLLGVDLWQITTQGPAEVLAQTENTQPVLLTASYALWELWAPNTADLAVLAGHSLGEYSALVCGGAIGFADGVRLVRRRGELMNQAVPVGQGGMAAVLGLEDEQVTQICLETPGQVNAVNFNAPGQVVIAGASDALNAAIEACKAAGARRALPLDVSGPFHSELMAVAAAELSEFLGAIEVGMPSVPVIHNVDAKVSACPKEIRTKLVAQLHQPVRWTACVAAMQALGATGYIECGPGNVLAGLLKRISRDNKCTGLSTTDGLQAARSTD